MRQQSGWYPDPDGTPGQLRWWDGQEWSDLTTTTAQAQGDSRSDAPADGDANDVISGPDRPAWGGGRWNAPWRERLRRPVPRGVRAVGITVVVVLVLALLTWRASRVPDSGVASSTQTGVTSPRPPGPPLSRVCSAGEQPALPPGGQPPAGGPRVADAQAGISYAQMGAPWQPWNQVWLGGTLGVEYRTGYFFVTQKDAQGTPGNDYLATVLSGSVPATAGDALHPDMRCVAQQVVADVRDSFYPSPNTRQIVDDQAVSVDGHPGYLIKFHLTFHVDGYDATGELASVLVVDVGTPRVAIVYQSIPDTHKQYDPVIDKVNASVTVP